MRTPPAAPAAQPPAPFSARLVATGSLQRVDPSRVVLKRVLLTGYPLKIRKRVAVVRYMFFNPGQGRMSSAGHGCSVRFSDSPASPFPTPPPPSHPPVPRAPPPVTAFLPNAVPCPAFTPLLPLRAFLVSLLLRVLLITWV